MILEENFPHLEPEGKRQETEQHTEAIEQIIETDIKIGFKTRNNKSAPGTDNTRY